MGNAIVKCHLAKTNIIFSHQSPSSRRCTRTRQIISRTRKKKVWRGVIPTCELWNLYTLVKNSSTTPCWLLFEYGFHHNNDYTPVDMLQHTYSSDRFTGCRALFNILPQVELASLYLHSLRDQSRLRSSSSGPIRNLNSFDQSAYQEMFSIS